MVLGWCVLVTPAWGRGEGLFCQELCFIPTCRVLSITHSSGLGFM